MTTALLTDTVAQNLASAADLALLWGVDGVALRSVGRDRVPHVNEAAVGARLRETELELLLVDPGLFAPGSGRAVWMNEVAAFDETAAFCRRLGARTVRCGALDGGPGAVDALRALGDAAAAAGLRLAVGNEAEGAATGAALAELLVAVAHPAVGADWRPAEALAAGETGGAEALVAAGVPVFAAEMRDPDAAGVDQTPGEGSVGWAETLATLAAAGFDGPLVLDLRGARAADASRRTVGLRWATALIRLARAAQP